MSTGETILFGCIGGLIPDALRFIKGRYELSIPAYLSKPNFWIGIILLIAVGGFCTWLIGPANVKEALAYGFSAPELLSKLFSKPSAQTDRGDARFDLRSWWAL